METRGPRGARVRYYCVLYLPGVPSVLGTSEIGALLHGWLALPFPCRLPQQHLRRLVEMPWSFNRRLNERVEVADSLR